MKMMKKERQRKKQEKNERQKGIIFQTVLTTLKC